MAIKSSGGAPIFILLWDNFEPTTTENKLARMPTINGGVRADGIDDYIITKYYVAHRSVMQLQTRGASIKNLALMRVGFAATTSTTLNTRVAPLQAAAPLTRVALTA